MYGNISLQIFSIYPTLNPKSSNASSLPELPNLSLKGLQKHVVGENRFDQLEKKKRKENS